MAYQYRKQNMEPMMKIRLNAGTNLRHLAPWLPLALALWQGALARPGLCQESPALPRGHVFLETDFEAANALQGWTRAGKLDAGCQSARALCFERGVDATGTTTLAEITLPVKQMRGYDVYLAAMIKAENVSETPAPYRGIKFMTLAVQGADKSYADAPLGLGTFDWKPVVFHVRVPHDATAFSLLVGLQGVSGKAWFDNIKVTVRKPPRTAEPRTAGPIHKGHDLPRLRGMQVSPSISEHDLRVLGQQWNANVVRLQLIRRGAQARGDLLDLAAYDRWLEGELPRLDAALALCEKYGLMAVVDLHSPPGGALTPSGYVGTSGRLFTHAACQKKFVEVWQRIARRLKQSRAVWGYDLANEPMPPRQIEPGLLFEGAVLTLDAPLRGGEEGLEDWEELAARAARAIRAIDPERTIIFEPPLGYSPRGLRGFQPIDVPNIVYSVHMYEPGAFTHQGVHELRTREPWVKKYSYPGQIDGQMWDKARLEAALQPVIDFQKTHGVHIFIGEFSVIRWAPDGSAHRYLRDLTDIFEEHGWDWTYHCFREGWDGWSVEHGPDRDSHVLPEQPTDREKLLREWFVQNRKPTWYRAP